MAADFQRAKRSTVWESFERVTKEAICKLCRKELAYYGGTTNLKEHLRRVHPEKQPCDDACFYSWRHKGCFADNCRHKAYWIVRCCSFTALLLQHEELADNGVDRRLGYRECGRYLSSTTCNLVLPVGILTLPIHFR